MPRPVSHKSVPAALMHERETSKDLINAQKKLIENLTEQVRILTEKCSISDNYITLLKNTLEVKEQTIQTMLGRSQQ